MFDPKTKKINLNNLKNQGEIKNILIQDIISPKNHDRTSFNKSDIFSLANSIKQNGLLHPIIVRQIGDKFERISGFRRLEAIKYLKQSTIEARVLKNIRDDDAIMLMAIENIQREDINIYDETIFILEYLSKFFNIEVEEIKTVLFKYKNFRSGTVKISKDQEDLINEIDKILKRFNKIAINIGGLADRLRLLKINPLLIELIRNKKIPYSFAIELNKIKDKELLQDISKEATKKNMTLKKLKLIISKHRQITKRSINPFSTLKNYKISDFNKLNKKQKTKIDQLIQKINKIIQGEKDDICTNES